MRPTATYLVRALLALAVVILGIIVLWNLPGGDNTVQLATGLGLVLAGVGLAIP